MKASDAYAIAAMGFFATGHWGAGAAAVVFALVSGADEMTGALRGMMGLDEPPDDLE